MRIGREVGLIFKLRGTGERIDLKEEVFGKKGREEVSVLVYTGLVT